MENSTTNLEDHEIRKARATKILADSISNDPSSKWGPLNEVPAPAVEKPRVETNQDVNQVLDSSPSTETSAI